MTSRSLGIICLFTVLLVAGTAGAQTVSLMLTPAQPTVNVTGGQSTSVSVDIQFVADQYACVEAVDVPVNVTVAANRLTAAVDPGEVGFTLEQGIHNSQLPQGSEATNQTNPTNIQVQAPSGQTSGFSEDITVTATFPGGYGASPESPCGPNEFPAAEGTTTITVNVQPDVTEPTDGDDDDDTGGNGGVPGGNNTGGNGDGEDTDDSPVGTWLLPLALVGAALILRRRQ